MLSLGKNRPGQMPEPKGPGPAGLSRAQVQTDGEDVSGGCRGEEARVGPWMCENPCSDSAICSEATVCNLLTSLISFLYF